MEHVTFNKLYFALLFVVLGLFAVFYALKIFKTKIIDKGQLAHSKLLMSLGPKERIVSLNIANKSIILGITATQIQTLYVFEEGLPMPEQSSFKETIGKATEGVKIEKAK